MHWLTKTCVAAVALAASGMTATPAAAAQPVKATISDAGRQTFATVTRWDPYVRMLSRQNSVDQQWELTERSTGVWVVRSTGSGLCLGVERASVGEGAPVVVRPCAGTADQQWKIPRFTPDGTVTFTSVASGRCMTQPLSTTADRRLREYKCDGRPLQRFLINRSV